MLTPDSPLRVLRANFLATSTSSMPIAGMAFWAVVAVASLHLSPSALAGIVGFGSGTIFPLALLLDKARGRTIVRASPDNPLGGMFLQSLVMVGLLWPLVIISSALAHAPNLVVLGGAILMALVWIPYGWAADDSSGLRHAIARCVLSYAAFLFAPKVYTATAIAAVVLSCYAFSLWTMRRPPSAPDQSQG